GTGSAGFTKLFPTGATLLAQFANAFVIDITNGTPRASITTLTLNLTQPLLQGGGKAVNLEPLTQSERTLLYQIRNYARFRKQFYVNVAAGQATGSSGLVDPALAAALAATTATRNVGYLPTVRQVATLEVDRENVSNFEKLLRLFEAFMEGGIVSQIQVDQIKQSLLNGRLQVLNDEQTLRGSLDSFKIQLGMPPTIGLELDDSPIRPITEQLARFQAVIDQYRATSDMIEEKYKSPDDALKLRERLKASATDSALVKGTAFRERVL